MNRCLPNSPKPFSSTRRRGSREEEYPRPERTEHCTAVPLKIKHSRCWRKQRGGDRSSCLSCPFRNGFNSQPLFAVWIVHDPAFIIEDHGRPSLEIKRGPFRQQLCSGFSCRRESNEC